LATRNRQLWGIGLLTVAALGAVLVYFAHHRILEYELLAAPPNAIPADPRLSHFAETLAGPAWRQNCAGCHGTDMKGDSARGVPNLIDAEWIYGSGELSQIEYTITYGIRSGNPKSRNLAIMPSFAHPNDDKEKLVPLSPGDIKDVIAYIFSLQGRPAAPDAATRGASIYADKGACYDCHAPDGRGDHDIGAPNLADTIWLYGDGSEGSIFRSIEKGRAGICPAWTGRLSPAVIRALAVFILDHSQTGIAPRP
jgi:cytochrome c oxidase cbb3-type subunit 3